MEWSDWNWINVLLTGLCWFMADQYEQWSTIWWANVAASAANGVAVLQFIL